MSTTMPKTGAPMRCVIRHHHLRNGRAKIVRSFAELECGHIETVVPAGLETERRRCRKCLDPSFPDVVIEAPPQTPTQNHYLRKTADWSRKPIRDATLGRLLRELHQANYTHRAAVLVLTGAIEKVIDNEADAKETIRRLRARRKEM
jgi:hypothetical protein